MGWLWWFWLDIVASYITFTARICIKESNLPCVLETGAAVVVGEVMVLWEYVKGRKKVVVTLLVAGTCKHWHD